MAIYLKKYFPIIPNFGDFYIIKFRDILILNIAVLTQKERPIERLVLRNVLYLWYTKYIIISFLIPKIDF